MTEINFCNFYPLDADRSFIAHSDNFTVLEERAGRCRVFIFVWRDFSRVFVGGGENGYDWIAREADSLQIEALADRYPRPELKQASALRTQSANSLASQAAAALD